MIPRFPSRPRVVRAFWGGVLLFAVQTVSAVPIIKVDSGQTMAAVGHPADRKFEVGDYLCVQKGGIDVACGKVTKATGKGAIFKFDFRYRTGEELDKGDEVILKKTAAESPDSPDGGGKTPGASIPSAGVPSVSAAKGAASTEEGPGEDEASLEKAERKARADLERKELAEKKKPKAKAGEEESVDLDAPEAAENESKATAPVNPHGGKLGTRPKFKALFDWWLTHQPGKNPGGTSVSFDAYHYLMILEIAPDPRFYFGFEVSTNPRFYELDYTITKGITLRAGRIYIPFDDLSPHSYFGGRANVTRLSQPGSNNAFLPDLWTDMGVGLKLTLLESSGTNLELNTYLVNGFQEGTSPSTNDSIYPNFAGADPTSGAPFLNDNNSAKSVGGRLQLSVANEAFVVGTSAYYGRYSAEKSPSKAILMLGLDSRVRIQSTEIRGGYAFMSAEIQSTLPSQSYVRGGFYLELAQYFGNWRVLARMGQSQNDSRIVQATDQTLVGGQLAYRAGPAQISIEHSHDLNQVVGKTYYSFSGLRVGLML